MAQNSSGIRGARSRHCYGSKKQNSANFLLGIVTKSNKSKDGLQRSVVVRMESGEELERGIHLLHRINTTTTEINVEDALDKLEDETIHDTLCLSINSKSKLSRLHPSKINPLSSRKTPRRNLVNYEAEVNRLIIKLINYMKNETP